ncbi:MAG: DUF2341 domain-containing protein, partial [Thermoplasmata archaeon]
MNKKIAIYIFALLLFGIVLDLALSQSGNWLSGWQYRIPITITERSGNTLTDYQVLVVINTQELISQNKMRSDCGDIRFTDSDGITLLNYWIESGCNTPNTRIWVKVPYIPANSNKTIYLYYKNSEATSLSSVKDVFIREIDGLVLHLTFDEGEGTIAYDSSGNNNHGTLINGPTWVDGKFGKALGFDGVDDYINVSATTSLDITRNISITVLFWFYMPDASLSRNVIVKDAELAICVGANSLIFRDNRGNGLLVSTTIENNRWYFYAGQYDKNTDSVRIFLNERLINEGMQGTWNPSPTSRIMTIGSGNYPNAGCSGRFFLGIIDEISIYKRALSQEEILDLYNNYGYSTPNYPGKTLVRKYVSPEPTVSLGNEQRLTSWLSGWQYRIPITITERSGNTLTDYQVLVVINTQNLISQGKMRSDCGDIRFTDSDGITLLNYWIESGCNTPNTRIWVKVPYIPANSNKTIYLYYKNSEATSLSSVKDVFIREIDGLVLHLTFDEGEGTIAYDSSGNNNHGTLINGPTWVDGKFGKALGFDGVDDYINVSATTSLDITRNISITVLFWFYMPDASLSRNVIVKDAELAICVGANSLIFRDNRGNGLLVSTTIENNRWYFYAGQYDKNTNSVRIFLNGRL